MTKKRDYHHGNLRQALIDAGISLLDEVGWTGLSLRACAARAGVSHAAPAYHFGNLPGLQTALAVVAFTRFHQTLVDYRAVAPPEREAQMRAAGEGYLRFATGNPGLFKLMFGGAELDRNDPELNAAKAKAFAQLGEIVAPFLTQEASEAEDYALRVSVWSLVHGYAHLLLAGQLDMLGVSSDGMSHLPDMTILTPPR